METEKIINRFKKLVKMDSLSGEESEVASYLEEELNELGFEVYRDDVGEKIDGETGNIIAKLAGDKEAPTLLLSAHMDTVGPGKSIEPIVDQGTIKSKGDTILFTDSKYNF